MKSLISPLLIHPLPDMDENIGKWMDKLAKANQMEFGVFIQYIREIANIKGFITTLNILTRYPVEKISSIENDFKDEFWKNVGKCPIKDCSYENKLPSNIIKHLWGTHNLGVNWHHCPNCERKFKAPRYLKNHLATKHGIGGEIFKCGIDDCVYETRDKKDLKKHQSYKHSIDIKWHYCPHCEHKSKRKPDLTKHIVDAHGIGGKIYKCPECDYENTQKSNLNRHVRDMHDPDATLYYCEYNDCTFSTKNKGYVKTHKARAHSIGLVFHPCPFTICGYKGKRKGDVTDHVKKVHGDGKNECPECEFNSVFKRELKKHLRDEHKN